MLSQVLQGLFKVPTEESVILIKLVLAKAIAAIDGTQMGGQKEHPVGITMNQLGGDLVNLVTYGVFRSLRIKLILVRNELFPKRGGWTGIFYFFQQWQWNEDGSAATRQGAQMTFETLLVADALAENILPVQVSCSLL